MSNDLTVYIPTMGRLTRQETWSWLPDHIQENTQLVTTPDEVDQLGMLGYPAVACPAKGIAATRQWIFDQHPNNGKLVMLDDDLRFVVRRTDEPTKFRKVQKQGTEITDAFVELSHLLDTTAMAGFAQRAGANRNTERFRYNTRIFTAWGLRVDVAREVGVEIDRVPLMEDFNTALQLHSRGYSTALVNNYVTDHLESNADGGCSTYRDEEAQEQAATQLASHWPDFVRLTEKPGWKGMGKRVDVTVQWKKALAQGVKDHGAQAVMSADLEGLL